MEWWQIVFDEKYTFTHEGSRPTEVEIKFLKKILRNKKKILDLPCGDGRLSIPLAEAGHKVTGVDYSEYLIKRAKRKDINHRVDFFVGDMRTYQAPETYDAIINMFSSFGYFENESEHQKVLHRAYKNLREGGTFLLDIVNAKRRIERIRSTPHVENQNQEGVVITQDSTYDPHTKRWNAMWSWSVDSYTTSVRLFTMEEITTLLENSKLEILNIWGSYSMKPFDDNESNRIILMTQKTF